MQYKNAKLMIVDQHPNDKITTKLLTKVLKELKIPIDKMYITSLNKSSNNETNIKILLEEIKEVQPIVVIALGKDVCEAILEQKIKKMSDVVGNLFYKHGMSQDIIPCYSCSYVVNHGQKELQAMKDSFTTARQSIHSINKTTKHLNEIYKQQNSNRSS